MSMYSDYLNELGIREVLESEHGFMTYYICGPECYITDMYIKPEARKSKHATALADQITKIAKDRGCTYLLGSIDFKSKTKNAALKTLLAYGFGLAKGDVHGLYLTKDL